MAIPPTKAQIDKAINNKTVKALVAAYLMQRAYYETMREAVDAVYVDVLAQIPIYEDRRYDNYQPRMNRITNHEYMYLSQDEESINRIWDEVDTILREKGLKPDEMDRDHCPALVAREQLREVEHMMIETVGTPIGITLEDLLCSARALENMQNFIDIIVGAIMSLPDFVPPIIGKKS